MSKFMRVSRANYILILIFCIAFMLRAVSIAIPINLDEIRWMGRGEAFAINLANWDLANTYLIHHPGVTNMWLIGTGLTIHNSLDYFFSSLGLDNLVCADVSCPISAWATVRLLQAVVTSLCMVGIFILSKRLLGEPIALIAISLLALEPFFLAYQRFITTDALQTNFAALAILMFLLYLQGSADRRWLVGSGIFMGLATASKIPALFVTPAILFWIVLIESGIWQNNFQKRGWLRQGIDITLWALVIGITLFAIWPVLWVNPLETLQSLKGGMLYQANRGRLFFLGQYTDSPGLLFYPLVLVLRLTPILQLGILSFLLIMVRPKLVSEKLLALGLVPVTVLILVSIPDTKIDRYIILCIPELVLVASAGWYAIFTNILHRINYSLVKADSIIRQFINNGFLITAFLVVFQLIPLVSHVPYYISYYNSWLGGINTAQNILMIGQGEGLEQAARWLNQELNNTDSTVCSWYDKVLMQYYQGKIHDISKSKSDEIDLINFSNCNRTVLYINQIQRQLPTKDFTEYFALQNPLHIVKIKGLDYAKVYPGLSPLTEDINTIQVPLDKLVNSQFKILGYNIDDSLLESNNLINLNIFWEVLNKTNQNWRIEVDLIDENENIVASEIKPGFVNGYIPVKLVEKGTKINDFHQVRLEANNHSSGYHIAVRLKPPEAESSLSSPEFTNDE